MDWLPAAAVALLTTALSAWLTPALRGLRAARRDHAGRLTTIEALLLEKDGRDPPLLREYATRQYVDDLNRNPETLVATMRAEMDAHDRRFVEESKRVADRFEAHERRSKETLVATEKRLSEKIDGLADLVRGSMSARRGGFFNVRKG